MNGSEMYRAEVAKTIEIMKVRNDWMSVSDTISVRNVLIKTKLVDPSGIALPKYREQLLWQTSCYCCYIEFCNVCLTDERCS